MRVPSDVPLYERDPDAWREYLAEGNRRQARKRVSADVLFRDRHGRVLFVDPVYKPGWDLPGGMADAARREIAEELGIEAAVGRLLVVDWVAPHGPWDDLLAFVFDGGVLEAGIRLADGELRGFRFVPVGAAETLVPARVWRRLCRAVACVETGAAAYLRNGEERPNLGR